jgi:hypothetical protein
MNVEFRVIESVWKIGLRINRCALEGCREFMNV